MLHGFRALLQILIAPGLACLSPAQVPTVKPVGTPAVAAADGSSAPPAADPQHDALVERFVARGPMVEEIAIVDPMQRRADIEDGNGPQCSFRLRTYADGLSQVVELLHDSPTSGRLWVDRAHRIDVARVDPSRERGRLPPPGVDVTGDGLPDLVLESSTGGAHCCFELTILQLRPVFREVQRISTQDQLATFQQLDGEPDLEITFGDPVFQYFHAGNADSAAPRVVLKWDSCMFLPSAEIMRRPSLPQPELERLAVRLREAGAGLAPSPPAELTRQLADLVYGGNADQAWWLAEHAWPESLTNRAGYLREFRERLWRSAHRDVLRSMNPGLEIMLAKDGFAPVRDRQPADAVDEMPDPASFVGRGPMVMQRVIAAPQPEPSSGEPSDLEAPPFIVRLYDDAGSGSFEVVRADERLLAIRGERMRILDTIPRRGERVEYFAPAIGEDAADHAPPDTDLDGDGFSEVIVSEYTGGAHCCFNLHVVRLHPEPSYQRLSLQHAEGGVFEQLDGDPALEVVMPDWSMAYWNCGFANSPTPVVVLDLADGAWRPSVALMRRPPASDAELRKMAELWTGWRCDAGGLWGTGVCRGDLALPWESMLDLIYSGNAAQARWVLDHGCEETPEKRDAFWADMIQHLHRSDAWDTLVALNGNPLTG